MEHRCPMTVKTYCPTCPFNIKGECVYYDDMPLPYDGRTVKEVRSERDKEGKMLAYFCPVCYLYFRETEILKGKKCPECRVNKVEPRLILCGQVMGADEKPKILK